MSKRALWLAVGALSVGFVVVSCSSSSDSGSNPDASGGESAGGEGNGARAGSVSKAGSKSSGGTDSPAQGGDSQSTAGTPATDGGASTAGTANGGQPGGGGEVAVGGAPVGGADSGEGGSGGDVTTDVACDSSADCDKGQYCLKPGCAESDSKGLCATPAATGPVCGCNGVTYYTGALAVAAAEDVAGRGICGPATATAKTCAGKLKCAEGETCGDISPRGSCIVKTTPICWQMPQACGKELQTYSECGSDKCETMCQAVKSGAHAIGNANCGLVIKP
jgi:hypothetical protein